MRAIFPMLAALLAAPAHAAVKSASPAGFEVEASAIVTVAPDEAYEMIGRIGEWWSSDHTYSRSSSNLSLELRPGGCFCEKLADGGGVEHGRVVFAMPGRLLRVSGAIGPLQAEAATGTLTWTLKPVAGGTEIGQDYKVGGYFPAGADKLAPIVDQVLGEQLERLRARLAR
jgi:hypothetical protein